MRVLSVVGLWALVGCERSTNVKQENVLDSVVEITQPTTLSQFREYEDVVFVGEISGVGDPSPFIAQWGSDQNGDLHLESVGSDGVSQFSINSLVPGDHTVTLSMIDTGGESLSHTVSITITDEVDAPTVSLVSPQGTYSPVGEEIPFSVIVDDLQDSPEEIQVEGMSDLSGDFCSMTPDETGLASCNVTLGAGNHVISIVATDSHGFQGELTFPWVVLSPDQIDDDGDGYTEDEGDCDDSDPNLSPDASEIADQIDNDCNGIIDDQTPYYDDDGDCFCETVPCSGTSADISSCNVLQGGDCNDDSNLDSPDADERCDGFDNDCDLEVDEYSAVDAPLWYVDATAMVMGTEVFRSLFVFSQLDIQVMI
jgi:hypothetical protein